MLFSKNCPNKVFKSNMTYFLTTLIKYITDENNLNNTNKVLQLL